MRARFSSSPTRPTPIPAAVLIACASAPSIAAAAGQAPPIGVGDLSRDQFVAPAATGTVTLEPPAPRQVPHTFFLNYDGPTLNPSSGYESDSQTNTSWVCSGSFSPFGEGQLKDASVQATKKDWAPYNVDIVTERPASGDFTMNVVGRPAGGNSGAGCGGGLGVAPVDCGNQNPNDISFTWITANTGHSADTIATTNSQEIAHTLGLGHVNDQGDIMNPYATGGDPSFNDQCTQVTGQLQSQCATINAMFCGGSGTSQNAHQNLLYLLGPKISDPEPPTVSITSPTDGDVLSAPASFKVVADATDNTGVAEVRILLDGMDQNNPLTAEPFSWDLAGVPEGTYTFEVVATDGAGNDATSAPVTVTVEVGADTNSGSDSGSDSDDPDEGDSGSGTGEDPFPPGDGDAEGERVDDGCGCATERTNRSPVWLLAWLVGLPMLRRQRRGHS